MGGVFKLDGLVDRLTDVAMQSSTQARMYGYMYGVSTCDTRLGSVMHRIHARRQGCMDATGVLQSDAQVLLRDSNANNEIM